MDPAYVKHLPNRAARRWRARRLDEAKATAEIEAQRDQTEAAAHGPVDDPALANLTIQASGDDSQIDGLLANGRGCENVTVRGCRTGVVVPRGASHQARGLDVRDNQIGVDNYGDFEGPDARFG